LSRILSGDSEEQGQEFDFRSFRTGVRKIFLPDSTLDYLRLSQLFDSNLIHGFWLSGFWKEQPTPPDAGLGLQASQDMGLTWIAMVSLEFPCSMMPRPNHPASSSESASSQSLADSPMFINVP
jgi:hypothetical protein